MTFYLLFWQQRRYTVGFLAFLGFFTQYMLRVNLSIAIVTMTKVKTIQIDGKLKTEQEFKWNKKTQGMLLGSFFYGYIFSQLPGGFIANRIGGKRVFLFSVLITSILTLLIPVFTKWSMYGLLVLRILCGIAQGVCYPCIHAVWAKWAPPLERSRLATFAFSGSYVGTVIGMPLAGIICDTIGWEYMFYIYGVIGLVWCVLWKTQISESPLTDPRISQEELNYLTETLTLNTKPKPPPPWGKIFRSFPVLAVVVSHFSENWGFYTILTQYPTFMNGKVTNYEEFWLMQILLYMNIYNYEIQSIGILSALPYLLMTILTPVAGTFADMCIKRKTFSLTNIRKLFTSGALLAQTAAILLTAYWLTPIGSLVTVSLAIGIGAFAWAGFSVNHLDICPQYASVTMGVANTFATVPGIVSPVITGYLINNMELDGWKVVFILSGVVYFLGAIIYALCASGERQYWAKDPEPDTPSAIESIESVSAEKSMI